MKTYHQTMLPSDRPFDWNLFLQRALKGKTSKREVEIAFNLSRSWTTCACGEQCADLPRSSSGCPLDRTLRELGSMFMEQIEWGHWIAAKNTLERIELRSAKLLAKLQDANPITPLSDTP